MERLTEYEDLEEHGKLRKLSKKDIEIFRDEYIYGRHGYRRTEDLIMETVKESLEELTGKNISDIHNIVLDDLSVSLSEFVYFFWDKTVNTLLSDIEKQVECLDRGQRYLGGADLKEV